MVDLLRLRPLSVASVCVGEAAAEARYLRVQVVLGAHPRQICVRCALQLAPAERQSQDGQNKEERHRDEGDGEGKEPANGRPPAYDTLDGPHHPESQPHARDALPLPFQPPIQLLLAIFTELSAHAWEKCLPEMVVMVEAGLEVVKAELVVAVAARHVVAAFELVHHNAALGALHSAVVFLPFLEVIVLGRLPAFPPRVGQLSACEAHR